MLKQAQAAEPAGNKERNTPRPAPAAPAAAAAPKQKVCDITCAAALGAALQEAREILLYSYYSSNIEICDFADGCIKYFDRKGDADFAPRLAAWLAQATGHEWRLERATQSQNTHTITEQKQEELEADPLVASAMNLFADAQIVGVSN